MAYVDEVGGTELLLGFTRCLRIEIAMYLAWRLRLNRDIVALSYIFT